MTKAEADRALLLLSDARHWRFRAEEIRSADDDMRDEICKETANPWRMTTTARQSTPRSALLS
jgi:hypothetical protein